MILIKNAETPESCGKCRIRRLAEDMNGDYIGICPFLSRRVSLRKDQREEDCPIVDLTEYEQAMIEEILSEKERPYIKLKATPEDAERLKELMNHTYAVIEKKDEKTDDSQGAEGEKN